MEILPNCYCNFNYFTERASAVFCLSIYWEAKPFRPDFRRGTIFQLGRYFFLNGYTI